MYLVAFYAVLNRSIDAFADIDEAKLDAMPKEKTTTRKAKGKGGAEAGKKKKGKHLPTL